MTNSPDFHARLHAAALRAIASNTIGLVGRDGRRRVFFETVVSQGHLADILREAHGPNLPRHEDDCASRGSMPAECDCPVLELVQRVREGGA